MLSVVSAFQAQRTSSSPTKLHYSDDKSFTINTNNEQQEAVNKYLDYIDRRYSRLYGDDTNNIRQKVTEQQQQQQTSHPFSGANGLPSESDVVALKSQIGEAILVSNDAAVVENHIPLWPKEEMNRDVLMRTVLMPVFRALCFMQRQRSLFWKGLRQCAGAAIVRATTGFISVPTSPRDALDTLLSIGGGRRVILRTMAIAYAAAIVLRNQIFVAA